MDSISCTDTGSTRSTHPQAPEPTANHLSRSGEWELAVRGPSMDSLSCMDTRYKAPPALHTLPLTARGNPLQG